LSILDDGTITSMRLVAPCGVRSVEASEETFSSDLDYSILGEKFLLRQGIHRLFKKLRPYIRPARLG